MSKLPDWARGLVKMNKTYSGGQPSRGGYSPHFGWWLRLISQSYYYRDEWQKGERESEKELAEGNYREFDDGESAAAWLDE